MGIEFEISYHQGLLRVRAWGNDENLEEVQRYSMAVIQACVEHDARLLLCDERGLEYELSATDTYRLAEFIAQNVPAVGKAAIVCAPQHLPDAFFWETTCVNRGLFVRAFTNMEEAEDWLKINTQHRFTPPC